MYGEDGLKAGGGAGPQSGFPGGGGMPSGFGGGGFQARNANDIFAEVRVDSRPVSRASQKLIIALAHPARDSRTIAASGCAAPVDAPLRAYDASLP